MIKLTFITNIFFVGLDNKLFDAVSELRHEILLLTIQNEKFKQESLQHQTLPGSAEGKATEKSSVILITISTLKCKTVKYF